MAKIPPAAWQNPEAFEPEETREVTEDTREVTEETQGDDGTFKRIAKEDDEAVEEPED